ncbi:hypothetical protein BD309DRAFT_1023922 [Dichomitus squalens]|uniref:Uncharacterized protein n=1 Tax=Dichomitus squalens TaxID=114155 RepID=A0A4Q9PGU0_9APHY|nr:hypothetical protein BD309DRAFT_1023922 [Dichomitus squalens]TBU53785.1 hypothetical protein BD310DRAFT_980876 [Dichomitus squalens]
MSKSSTTSAPEPSQLPSKGPWAKGPPANTPTAPSSRSRFPAPRCVQTINIQVGRSGRNAVRTSLSDGSLVESRTRPYSETTPSSLADQQNFEPVAPIELSANRWTPASLTKKGQPVETETPEVVDRKGILLSYIPGC